MIRNLTIRPGETRPVDLHVHSNRSDGSETPSVLVDMALEKGLAAFALTDHDTTDGLADALAYAADKDIEVIPGIEFSTEYEGRDIHVVGLYIDYTEEHFQHYLKDFQNSRDLRNQKMCKKLQEHGVDITYEQLLAEYPGSVLTRAHYARFLLAHGYVKGLPEAFDRYVGDHAPCYIPREKVTPMQAVHLICKVVAFRSWHIRSCITCRTKDWTNWLPHIKQEGLAGIEAIYSTYNAAEERQIRKLAAKYELLLSGGSDFHGAAKPGLSLGNGYGKLYVPYEILAGMKQYLSK